MCNTVRDKKMGSCCFCQLTTALFERVTLLSLHSFHAEFHLHLSLYSLDSFRHFHVQAFATTLPNILETGFLFPANYLRKELNGPKLGLWMSIAGPNASPGHGPLPGRQIAGRSYRFWQTRDI